MAKRCQLTGKGPATGNNRSHSLRATRRRFMPNVSKKNIVNPLTGTVIKVKLSTRAQKTLMKNPGKFSKIMRKLARA